jgi:hypothetical protein
MKRNKILYNNDNLNSKTKIATSETKKQKRLTARKKIEDHLAEKQLRENIKDFDFGY